MPQYKKNIGIFFRGYFIPALDSMVSPKNIISLLILYCPFTIGEWIPGNYIYVVLFFDFILFMLLAKKLVNHNRILTKNYNIPIILFAVSFFLSMIFGLPYKQMNDFTDYDSSLAAVALTWTQVILMQISLIYFVYLSIDSFEDIVHYLKVFLLSGIIVNFLGLIFMITGAVSVVSKEYLRVGLSFSDSNYLGRFEVIIIVIIVSFLSFRRTSFPVKLAAFGLVFVSFYFLLLSISRGALVSLGLALLIIMLYYKSKILKYTLISITGFIFFVLIIYVAGQKVGPFADSSFAGSFVDLSNATRVALVYASIKMFFDYPVFGVGIYNFYNIYLNYGYVPVDMPLGIKITVVHSWFFSTLAEQGLAGLFPILFVFLNMIRDLISFVKKTSGVGKFLGIGLLAVFFVVLFNGFLNPIFYAELLFSLVCGIIGGYFKICSLNGSYNHQIESVAE